MTRTAASPVFASLALASILLLPGPAPAQDDPGVAWRPPDLIDAVASFGAVAHDDALYVYGGHVGRTHAHSIEISAPGSADSCSNRAGSGRSSLAGRSCREPPWFPTGPRSTASAG